MVFSSRSSTQRFVSILSLTFCVAACASGQRWVAASDRPHSEGVRLLDEDLKKASDERPANPHPTAPSLARSSKRGPAENELADAPGKRPLLSLQERGSSSSQPTDAPPDAKLVGVFRNTYYDFPAETDFSGPKVPVKNASCETVREVPRPFFEALCVQGSGTLATGATVSFRKRDCECAEVCPRTGQKICFDALDQKAFPWGRGALGKAITPLRTIAVDSNVIPLGTSVYIAEFDGVPRSPGGSPHDGCFVAEDRGLKVQGEHVDIFTGNPHVTEHLNKLVPSNRGVHVYTGTARCQTVAP